MRKPVKKRGFEQSRFDKEKPGVKEGSKEDRAADKKQMAAFKKAQKR